MEHPKPGVYRHFKNKMLYRLHCTAVHTETLEDLVAYEPLYENELLGERKAKLFVRPLSMFCEHIEHEGVRRPRFEYVGDEKPAE